MGHRSIMCDISCNKNLKEGLGAIWGSIYLFFKLQIIFPMFWSIQVLVIIILITRIVVKTGTHGPILNNKYIVVYNDV